MGALIGKSRMQWLVVFVTIKEADFQSVGEIISRFQLIFDIMQNITLYSSSFFTFRWYVP